MNKLAIVLKELPSDEGENYIGIQIFVDDADLRRMVRRFELPMAKLERVARIAGAYHFLDAATVNRSYFLGSGIREYGIPKEKVALMGCSCGVVSCWPLLARIRVGEHSVVWDEFEQPHRSTESKAGHWEYAGFGPFEFERTQYLEALSALAKGC